MPSWSSSRNCSARRSILEFVPNTASFPSSHPLFRGQMTRLAPDVRKVLDQHDVLFSVGADLFTLSLPSDDRSDAARHRAHPSRRRSLGDRQELSAQGGDPRRSEGHAAGPHRRRARAHVERRAAARRATGSRPQATPVAAERAALQAKARALRGRGAGAAAGAAARHRRDAAEGRRRDRGGAVLQPRHPAADPQPTIRRAISACAAAASAGACRRPSASSSRCRTGRWSGSSATAASLYTIQALWTAARYRIGAVFVILNNTSYRILKQRLHAMRGLARAGRHLCRHGAHRPGGRFRRAGALARRRGRARQDRARGDRSAAARRSRAAAPMLIDVELDRAFKPM